MSLPTFYLAPQFWGETLKLEKSEAAHVHALRLKAGCEAKVIDGMGNAAFCKVERICKKSVELQMLRQTHEEMPKSLAIIALALSKAARRSFFMEKAAELNAHAVWIWQAEYSQGKISQNLAEACRAQMIAGCKQCGNPWLPKVYIFDGVEAIARESASMDWRIMPFEAQAGQPMLTEELAGREGVTIYVIGPEGGFSPYEVECLETAQFARVSLGTRVLRCETAATLCLGLHWLAAQKNCRHDYGATANADL